MSVAYKDVEPFVGLLATSAFMALASRFLRAQHAAAPGADPRKPRRLAADAVARRGRTIAAATAGLALGFAVLCVLLILLKAPSMLQGTHPYVVQLKADAREVCRARMADMDVLGAEAAIRDNAASKKLALEFQTKQIKTIDRALRPIVNQVFFRTGAFCAVLPVFLALVADVALRAAAGRLQLPDGGVAARILRSARRAMPSEADYELVLLPLLQMALAYTWVATLGFHFWLRERQVTRCMLLSGHWYTALHTCVCLAAALLWLRQDASDSPARGDAEVAGARRWTGPGSALVWYVGGWAAAYAALTSRTLSSSQQFHHDWQESVEGVKSVVFVMPWALAAAAAVLLATLSSAALVEPVDEAEQAQGQGQQRQQLRVGGTAEVLQAFAAEGEGELSVAAGDLVQVLGPPDAGWVDVRSEAGAAGFVPESFLAPSSRAMPAAPAQQKPAEQPQEKTPKQQQDKQQQQQQQQEAKEQGREQETAKSKTRPTRAVPFLNDIKQGNVHLRKKQPSETSKSKPASQPAPASSSGGGSGDLFSQLKQRLAQNREHIAPRDDDAGAATNEWQ